MHKYIPLLYAVFVLSSLLLLSGCIDDKVGTTGKNALVAVKSEPPGDNCSYGGQRIDSGTDLNRNDSLDSDEVTATSYVCNGSDGKDGKDGLNALVDITEEAVGVNCRDGGLRIDTGLDLDGNDVLEPAEVMQTGYVCQASAAGIGWQVPQYVKQGAPNNAGRAHVAMDKNGNAIAVWAENNLMTDVEVEYTPGEPVVDTFVTGNVWVNHYIAKRGWGEAQRLDVTIAHPRSVETPKVVFNEDASAVLVWVQEEAVNYVTLVKSLAARRYVPGDGWGEVSYLSYIPSTVTTNTSANIYSVESGSSGDVLVYWNYNHIMNNFNYYLFDRFTHDGWVEESLSLSERALETGTYLPLPGKAAADGNGNIVAVGGRTASACGGTCIGWSWLKRYTPQSGWGEALDLHMFNDGAGISESDGVSRSYSRSGNPDIAANSAGNALVAWWELNAAPAESRDTDVMIMASYFDPQENNWSDAQFVSQSSGMAALHPDSEQQTFDPAIEVVVMESGDALVAWRQIDKTRGDYDSGEIHIDLWSNRFDGDSGWGTPQRIEAAAVSVAADSASLVMLPSRDNEVIAVWRQADDTVWSNRYVSGSGWGEAQRLDGSGEYVDLAIAGDGSAMALWAEAAADNAKDIFVSRYIAP